MTAADALLQNASFAWSLVRFDRWAVFASTRPVLAQALRAYLSRRQSKESVDDQLAGYDALTIERDSRETSDVFFPACAMKALLTACPFLPSRCACVYLLIRARVVCGLA